MQGVWIVSYLNFGIVLCMTKRLMRKNDGIFRERRVQISIESCQRWWNAEVENIYVHVVQFCCQGPTRAQLQTVTMSCNVVE
jgi:hypothetical protein